MKHSPLSLPRESRTPLLETRVLLSPMLPQANPPARSLSKQRFRRLKIYAFLMLWLALVLCPPHPRRHPRRRHRTTLPRSGLRNYVHPDRDWLPIKLHSPMRASRLLMRFNKLTWRTSQRTRSKTQTWLDPSRSWKTRRSRQTLSKTTMRTTMNTRSLTSFGSRSPRTV